MSNRDQLEQLLVAVDAAGGPFAADSLRATVEAAMRVPAPPGDPAWLEQSATTMRKASPGMDSVHNTAVGIALRRLPDAWVGATSETASDVAVLVARGIGESSAVLFQAGRELNYLGDDLAAAQRDYVSGNASLAHAMTLLGQVADIPPLKDIALGHTDQNIDAARGAARDGIQLLLGAVSQAEDAGQRFVREFGQFATEARASRLSGNGLTNADKLVLAEAAVPGGVPILSVVDMARASAAMSKLSSEDSARLDLLLMDGKSPEERAYLLKALAAGYKVDDIATFDHLIHAHGDDAMWLGDRLSPASSQANLLTGTEDGVDYDDAPWAQGGDPTCVSSSTVLARAFVDPVYALGLTTGFGPGNPKYDNGHAFAARLRDAQQQLYKDNRGFFADWPLVGEGPGLTDSAARNIANSQIGAHTGTSYHNNYPKTAADRQALLQRIETSVDDGVPVPVGITATGDGGHQVMVIGHDEDRLEIYNPWGFTSWIREDDFVNNHMERVAPPSHHDKPMSTADVVVLPK